VDSFSGFQKVPQKSPKIGPIFYKYLILFIKYVCTKNGQNEKEVDFKSYLKMVFGFIHKISTEAVE
jgi:hypothetical protein